MEGYKPIDYKVARPPHQGGGSKKTSSFSFSLRKRDYLYILLLTFLIAMLFWMHNRLSIIEETFKKEIEQYERNLIKRGGEAEPASKPKQQPKTDTIKSTNNPHNSQ